MTAASYSRKAISLPIADGMGGNAIPCGNIAIESDDRQLELREVLYKYEDHDSCMIRCLEPGQNDQLWEYEFTFDEMERNPRTTDLLRTVKKALRRGTLPTKPRDVIPETPDSWGGSCGDPDNFGGFDECGGGARAAGMAACLADSGMQTDAPALAARAVVSAVAHPVLDAVVEAAPPLLTAQALVSTRAQPVVEAVVEAVAEAAGEPMPYPLPSAAEAAGDFARHGLLGDAEDAPDNMPNDADVFPPDWLNECPSDPGRAADGVPGVADAVRALGPPRAEGSPCLVCSGTGQVAKQEDVNLFHMAFAVAPGAGPETADSEQMVAVSESNFGAFVEWRNAQANFSGFVSGLQAEQEQRLREDDGAQIFDVLGEIRQRAMLATTLQEQAYVIEQQQQILYQQHQRFLHQQQQQQYAYQQQQQIAYQQQQQQYAYQQQQQIAYQQQQQQFAQQFAYQHQQQQYAYVPPSPPPLQAAGPQDHASQ